jgi:hypothetical protein
MGKAAFESSTEKAGPKPRLQSAFGITFAA